MNNKQIKSESIHRSICKIQKLSKKLNKIKDRKIWGKNRYLRMQAFLGIRSYRQPLAAVVIMGRLEKMTGGMR